MSIVLFVSFSKISGHFECVDSQKIHLVLEWASKIDMHVLAAMVLRAMTTVAEAHGVELT